MYFSRKEVTRISTLNEGHFDVLRQHKIVVPSERIGQQRYYTPYAFFLILLIRELHARNFDYESIRRVYQQVEWREPKRLPWEAGLRWCLTDGHTAHFIADPDVVLAFLEQRRSPTFVLISLKHIEQRMQEARPQEVVAVKKPVQPVSPQEYFEQRQEQWGQQRA